MTQKFHINLKSTGTYEGLYCPELDKTEHTSNFIFDFLNISDSISINSPKSGVIVSVEVRNYITEHFPFYMVKFYDKKHDKLVLTIEELVKLNPLKVVNKDGKRVIPLDEFPIVIADVKWNTLDDLLDNAFKHKSN